MSFIRNEMTTSDMFMHVYSGIYTEKGWNKKSMNC
jgi:hypothetical protein